MKVKKFSDYFKIYGSYRAFVVLAGAMASSMGASMGMLYLLGTILLTGNRVLVGEPNILILLTEVGLMVVAVLFNLVLILMLLRNQLTGEFK